jgi:hypothetical protein
MKNQNGKIISIRSSGVAMPIRCGRAVLPSGLAGGMAWLVMVVLALSAGSAAARTLMDRYSFTTDATDSVGTNNCTVFGAGRISGGMLNLDYPTGTIDELRIYNGELTIDQIRASRAAGPDTITKAPPAEDRNNNDFTTVPDGYGAMHTTSHLAGKMADGDNLLFADSHVQWRNWTDKLTTNRTGACSRIVYFWW